MNWRDALYVLIINEKKQIQIFESKVKRSEAKLEILKFMFNQKVSDLDEEMKEVLIEIIKEENE